MEGKNIYGLLVNLKSDGSWECPDERVYLTGLSQEHGIIEFPEGIPANYSVGDIVGILPVHSCLTSNLMKGYRLSADGDPIDHFNGRNSHT